MTQRSARFIPHSRRQARTHMAPASAVFLLLTLILAGCGQSRGASGATGGAARNTSTAQSSTVVATPATTASSTPGTGIMDNGAGLSGCPGGIGTLSDAGTPQLVLGVAGSQMGSVSAGQLVQVRLPATTRWSFHGAAAAAGLLQPSGYVDRQHNVCVWNFRPPAAASLTLSFNGMALCTGKGPCPQFVVVQTFSVQVA